MAKAKPILSKRTQQLLQSYMKKPTPLRYQKVFNNLLPFIESVTRRALQKQGLPTWKYQEFLADSWLAFESTMQKLDAEKLITFKHFLGMKIRYAVLDKIRRDGGKGRSRYAPESIESVDWDGQDYSEAVQYEDTALNLASHDDDFEALISSLSDMQKQVFRGIFLYGKLQREVAEELGFSEGRISQYINRTLKQMREEAAAPAAPAANNANKSANKDEKA